LTITLHLYRLLHIANTAHRFSAIMFKHLSYSLPFRSKTLHVSTSNVYMYNVCTYTCTCRSCRHSV